MSNLAEIQSMLDSEKENMPSGVYLKLCNKMKTLYEETEEKHQQTEYFCEVTYVYPIVVNTGDRNEYDIHIRTGKQIIKYTLEEIELITHKLINNEKSINSSHMVQMCDKIKLDERELKVYDSYDDDTGEPFTIIMHKNLDIIKLDIID